VLLRAEKLPGDFVNDINSPPEHESFIPEAMQGEGLQTVARLSKRDRDIEDARKKKVTKNHNIKWELRVTFLIGILRGGKW
jgi:hypothetical protein